jgi:hypothetical protein
MTEIKQGTATIAVPDSVPIPPEAGTLSPDELRRLPKPKKGLWQVCEATAEALNKDPARLSPHGVTADKLVSISRAAESMEACVIDMKAMEVRATQASLILSGQAYDELRKVLTFVRGQQKFDNRIADLVPQLIEYFSHQKNGRPSQPASSPNQ